MRKDNSIYNKKQPGLYIYLYLQSQIPTSCYSGKKTIRHFVRKVINRIFIGEKIANFACCRIDMRGDIVIY